MNKGLTSYLKSFFRLLIALSVFTASVSITSLLSFSSSSLFPSSELFHSGIQLPFNCDSAKGQIPDLGSDLEGDEKEDITDNFFHAGSHAVHISPKAASLCVEGNSVDRKHLSVHISAIVLRI